MNFDIVIEDNTSKYFLNIKNNKLVGFCLKNGEIINADSNVINVLNNFKLSENNNYLGKYNEYDIYIDLNSGLKHFFKNGKENINLLFYGNGESIIEYSHDEKSGDSEYLYGDRLIEPEMKILDSKKYKRKYFFEGVRVCICFLALEATLLGLVLDEHEKKCIINYTSFVQESKEENYLEIIKNKIYSSPYLNDHQKNLLYDEDYLNDIVPYIMKNPNNYVTFLMRLDNIKIEYFGYEYVQKHGVYGYYSGGNVLHVYDGINDPTILDEVIDHEFRHLCQFDSTYTCLTEDGASFCTLEGYGKNYSYDTNTFTKLLQVISKDAFYNYMYADMPEEFYNEVSEYLTSEEMEEFKDSLIYVRFSDSPQNYEEINSNRKQKLNELITVMYERKYGVSPEFLFNIIDGNNEFIKIEFNLTKPSEVTIKQFYSLDELYKKGFIQFKLLVDENDSRFDKNNLSSSYYIDNYEYYASDNDGNPYYYDDANYFSKIIGPGNVKTITRDEAVENGIIKFYSIINISYDEYNNLDYYDRTYSSWIVESDSCHLSSYEKIEVSSDNLAIIFNDFLLSCNTFTSLTKYQLAEMGLCDFYVAISEEEAKKYKCDDLLCIEVNRELDILEDNYFYCDIYGNPEYKNLGFVATYEDDKLKIFNYSDAKKNGHIMSTHYYYKKSTKDEYDYALKNGESCFIGSWVKYYGNLNDGNDKCYDVYDGFLGCCDQYIPISFAKSLYNELINYQNQLDFKFAKKLV